ncbi:hypothetical protein D9619_004677 [Psilocybe cf. subviscida]|uniref:SET domain-containing protein n=1 Tax=Psilocybe cf. subviscida TaxID=2480587 RepID=A0A8H5BR59_9AGAR|nr:hypothetical protein D9619_004677 [Psilocybe cf. subviscida]
MSSFTALKQGREAKDAKSRTKRTVYSESNISDAPGSDSAPSNAPTLYTALPSSLDIRAGGNGRGIYSKYMRRPGDILFTTRPHVAALSNDNLDQYCASCFRIKTGALKKCSGCKLLCYCDDACQKRDWIFHKHECAAVQKWYSSSNSVPGDAIRCLGRILWRKQKLGRESVWAREIDLLESHRASLSKDPSSQEAQMYAQLAQAIVHFMGLTSPQDLAEYGMDSAGDLVNLISRFTTNTFTVSTPSLEPLGACVSPTVALINHSCDPNAVVVFPRTGSNSGEEPLMHVIALKHIAPDEEVLTAYIDTTLPTSKRQALLKDTYHFSCQCGLCRPPHGATINHREAMWCPKKCGGVCPVPIEEDSLTQCARCKAPVKDTDAVLDALRVGQEALDKAEALQFSNPEKAIQLTTKLVPILTSAGLVPGSHPLLALTRLNSSLLITHLPATQTTVEGIYTPGIQTHQLRNQGAPDEPQKRQYTTPGEAQEALDEAIRAATRASNGLNQILTEGHPVRGIALAELGKLLAVDEPAPTDVTSSNTPNSTSSPLSPSPIGGLKRPPPYPPSGPARLKLAYQTLVRARSELVIGFGGGKNEGGAIGKSVRDQAVELEKEIAVWTTGLREAARDKMAVDFAASATRK